MTTSPMSRPPMSRSLPAFLLGCGCCAAMSVAIAGDVQGLPAGDAPDCPAEVAAAKAGAEAKRDDAASQAAKPAQAPVRAKPTLRGADAPSPASRLQAPRWHSFLPGMFR